MEAADSSAALVINDEQGAAAQGLQGCTVQSLGLRQTGWGLANTAAGMGGGSFTILLIVAYGNLPRRMSSLSAAEAVNRAAVKARGLFQA